MGNGVYVAVSGAKAQVDMLDTVANNVANASTVGYRAERVSFGATLARAQSPDMQFAGVTRTAADQTAGPLQKTDNPLDVALLGDGFFSVKTGNGTRYTRAGDFRLDAQGTLVSSAGHQVLGVGGAAIQIPEGTASVDIDGEGRVNADGAEVGQLDIARFSPDKMRREGSNLFAAKGKRAADGEPAQVVSGTLESSNVNVVRGMVGLVRVSRTYEALLRMIENYREIDSRTAREIGRPR